MKLPFPQKAFLSIITYVLIAFSNTAFGQLRLDRLALKPKEVYKIIESDILVVDELVMGDSSVIFLDMTKTESFLHFKSIQIGKGCLIVGRGKDGLKGVNGLKGKNGNGPCADGLNGTDGKPGTAGGLAANLSIYLSQINILGSLTIDLSGGDGGVGGKGGNGGNGTGGTRVCQGGDAGKGGDGGDGGRGGDGGTLKIVCNNCSTSPVLLENQKLFFRVFAGTGGDGGQEGKAGNQGVGKKDGKPGTQGLSGATGVTGARGSYWFIL
jgi:hypothetical protein